MIISVKKLITLQIFFLFLFSFPAFGQNEIEIKQKIQSSLENFMANLSYINDEDEPILASTIASEFGGGNYFIFNGKEMKLEHFIEDYCHSDLQRQIVNHTLVLTREGIVKFDSDKADKRWSVNAILKREYASNPNIKIDDEKIKFIVFWNGINEHLYLLDISFQSRPRTHDGVISNQGDVSIIVENIEGNEYSNNKVPKRMSFFSLLKPVKNQFSIRLLSSFDKRGVLGFGLCGNFSFFHYGIEAVFAGAYDHTRVLDTKSDNFRQFFYELSTSITGETIVETVFVRPKAQLTITPGIFLRYISLECGLGVFMGQKVISRYVRGYYENATTEDLGNSNFFLIRPTITGHVTKWLSMSLGYNICPEAKPFNTFIFGIGLCF